MEIDENILTLNQAAKMAGLSVPSLIGHINRGNIKVCMRPVRSIHISEVQKFMEIEKDARGHRRIKRPIKLAAVEEPIVDINL